MNHLLPILLLLTAPPLLAAPPPIERVEIRAEGLFVNGKPFFPVGVDHAAHWHYSLPEAGEKGFNLVMTHGLENIPESFRYDIDEAYANGMYSLAMLTNGVWKNKEATKQIILACRNAPGLLAWGLEHEPDLLTGSRPDSLDVEPPYRYPPASFTETYAMIKRLDPVHPVEIELTYGNRHDHTRYSVVTDIHRDMILPIPSASPVRVAEYADEVIAGAGGKPCWLELQMLAVGGRHPTMAEVRCMTYLAIAHGISGVTYQAFHYGDWWVTDSPGYWAQWSDHTAELRRLTPQLMSPVIDGLKAEIVEGSQDALHTSLRRTETGYFLIAVNGSNAPVTANFTVPVLEAGLAPHAAVRCENRLVDVKDGVITDTFAGYAVHLYEIFEVTNIDPYTVDWPRWQRRPHR